MQLKSTPHCITFLIMLSWVVFFLGSASVVGQEEDTKGIKPVEAGIRMNPRRKTKRVVTFRTPNPFKRRAAPAGTKYAQVGVTIWRVDEGHSKGSVEQEGEEQTIERVDTNSPYTDGDTIRLTIESPTAGFLYIIDQEQYSDGSYSPAMLVFPTLKTRKGKNFVSTWESVDIPAFPAVWRFTPRKLEECELRKEQTREVLTIIISQKRLVAPQRLGDEQLKLNKGEFENWRSRWQKPIQQFDVEGAVGEIFSTRGIEQVGEEAGAGNEIGAQTTYRVAIMPGTPIFVTLPLKFRSSASSEAKTSFDNKTRSR
jgi:hypothetical protein